MEKSIRIKVYIRERSIQCPGSQGKFPIGQTTTYVPDGLSEGPIGGLGIIPSPKIYISGIKLTNSS
jgi:hypothetical protein